MDFSKTSWFDSHGKFRFRLAVPAFDA